MADNVVELRPEEKETLIYHCGECGSTTFYLLSDGHSECAACNGLDAGGEWVTRLEDDPRSPEKDNGGAFNVKNYGTPIFARERVIKTINQRKDEVALVAAWWSNGGMTLWECAETPEQQAWCVERLREAADNLALRKVEGA